MIHTWKYGEVPIKFQLSDKTLFVRKLFLQMREVGLNETVNPVADPSPPSEPPMKGSQGFLIRSLPVTRELPRICKIGRFFRYIPSQYRRYYIDLTQSFDDYQQQFSSKTRSTILRKLRKFEEHSGGKTVWKVYNTPSQMTEFLTLARVLSARTYQEKVLDAGLPDSSEFCQTALALAAEGNVRAFILFDRDRPVSYLYCPIKENVLIYQYVGYDPDYAKLSVGTVLQWVATRHLINEAIFLRFDFTEGEAEHKRLFATHSVQCANIFFIQANLQNRVLLSGQIAVDFLSTRVGTLLDQWGMKARVKKLIRFGM